MRTRNRTLLIAIPLLVLAAIGLYYLPPIHDRLAWRIEDLQTTIYYFFNPPEEVVFVPTQQNVASATFLPTATPTRIETAASSPTATGTPGPSMVMLEGIIFVDQMHRWNYCGPANLAMALEYWGWSGEPGNAAALRDQIGGVVKPGVNDPDMNFVERSQTDVNVMPYEMVDYVNDHTSLRALFRYGGDLDLLKRLVAAGFPVVTEKGIYQTLPPEQTMQWAGHYAFTTGYDEAAREFIYQDSYTPDEDLPPESQGMNVRMSYDEYVEGWRAFNYLFIVVYPPEREAELFQLLGPWLDEAWAAQNAIRIGQEETASLSGIDQFFAWFNLGTSQNLLTDYGQGALAFDTAFSIYNQLPEKDRPYRIFWYQTGPYRAYFYTSRYQDVIALADKVESTLFSHRVLEETLYYRAQAYAALGYYDTAYADLRKAVQYNPNFGPGLTLLAQWGISP